MILNRRNLLRAWTLLRTDGPRALVSRARHQLRSRSFLRRSDLPFLKTPPIDGELLGMTSPEEQAWLRWYAGTQYTGRGELVDLGCWLGSSTIPLAVGLAGNGRVSDRAGRIHAYDLFRWEAWMEWTAIGTDLAERYAPGDTFTDEFRRRIARWDEFIVTVPGDLTVVGWAPAKPIELLFNDASKSPELASAILRDFYPFLVPGLTTVVEQDFAHYYTPWVHLIRHRLRPWFEPVLHVPFSGSAVFRQVAPVPAEELTRDHGLDTFDDAEIEDAFAASLKLVSPESRANVLAAKVMLHVHRGDRERAHRELESIRRAGIDGMDLLKVRKELESDGD